MRAREIDAALVRWLGAKLADSDQDTCEGDPINYLIALALHGLDGLGECGLWAIPLGPNGEEKPR